MKDRFVYIVVNDAIHGCVVLYCATAGDVWNDTHMSAICDVASTIQSSPSGSTLPTVPIVSIVSTAPTSKMSMASFDSLPSMT
jgi:hypothetical protein